MSKKSAINLKTLVLCLIIIVGLVLAIVGMFGNFLKWDAILSGTTYAKLSDLSDLNDLAKKVDSTYEGYAVTNIFAWVTFILAIVVTVCFAVAKFLGVNGLNTVVSLIGCLTVVAAILVFVFALVMANKHDVSIASGPIMMLIGGLLAGGSAAASGKI
ncbi:MAG: hypothetical protein J6Z04_00155 [Clostridia bacterium]|nr:hypothetical protein [Clostridia bacterium]